MLLYSLAFIESVDGRCTISWLVCINQRQQARAKMIPSNINQQKGRLWSGYLNEISAL